jgi:SPP1 gp7 family putative phage head morphogenesis protein
VAARFDLRQLLDPKARIKRRATPMTRQARLAMTPSQPVAIQLRYTRALFDILDTFRAQALRTLEPVLRDDATTLVAVPKLDATDYTPLFQSLRIRLGELLNEDRLSDLARSIAGDINEKNASDISSILGIDLTRDGVLREYAEGFIRENVNLIESVAYDELGTMETLVREAQSTGLRAERLRENILESFDVSKSRATLIARDQTLKANADMTQLRQQRAGVTDYIWSCSQDERVRGRPGGKWANTDSDHWSLDGQRFSWLQAPVTNPVTGARNHPGKDFQCRCVALPVTDGLLSGL